MRGARRTCPVYDHVGNTNAQSLLEHRLHRGQPCLFGLMLGQQQLGRRGKAHGERHVLRARATSAILRAAVKHWLERRVAPDEQRTDAFGRTDLVSRDREQVEWGALGVDRDFTECLDGIRVKYRARRLRLRGDRCDVLNHPDFVVHPHHARHCHTVVEQLREVRAVHSTVVCDTHEAFCSAFVHDLMHGREHGLVLGGRGEGRVASVPPQRSKHTQDREVVTFRSAGCETHFVGERAERHRQPLTRFIERNTGFTAPPMHAGGIAEPHAEVGRHGGHDLVAHRRGGGVIQVHGINHPIKLQANVHDLYPLHLRSWPERGV